MTRENFDRVETERKLMKENDDKLSIKAWEFFYLCESFSIPFFTNPVLFGHGPEISRWCFISFHFRFVLLNSWRKLLRFIKVFVFNFECLLHRNEKLSQVQFVAFYDEAFIRGHELRTFKMFTPRQPHKKVMKRFFLMMSAMKTLSEKKSHSAKLFLFY